MNSRIEIDVDTMLDIVRIMGGGAYLDLCIKDEDRICGIQPLAFTYALLADMNEWGYEDRWCYKNYASAKAALDAWDGKGEPKGWHRHPGTGRRVDENGKEYINL